MSIVNICVCDHCGAEHRITPSEPHAHVGVTGRAPPGWSVVQVDTVPTRDGEDDFGMQPADVEALGGPEQVRKILARSIEQLLVQVNDEAIPTKALLAGLAGLASMVGPPPSNYRAHEHLTPKVSSALLCVGCSSSLRIQIAGDGTPVKLREHGTYTIAM